jgi:hypothetical protein
MKKNSKCCLPFLFLLPGLVVPAAWAQSRSVPEGGGDQHVSPSEALAGVRAFFARTARDDGSFAPGIDPAAGSGNVAAKVWVAAKTMGAPEAGPMVATILVRTGGGGLLIRNRLQFIALEGMVYPDACLVGIYG